MNWTPTPPTEPGLYYWRMDDKHSWEALRIGKFFNQLKVCVAGRTLIVRSIGGEWGGRVPAPGTTFTEKEIFNWLSSIEQRYKKPCMFTAKLDLQDKDTGIAATTELNRKEQG